MPGKSLGMPGLGVECDPTGRTAEPLVAAMGYPYKYGGLLDISPFTLSLRH
jgi:hypothetical protein